MSKSVVAICITTLACVFLPVGWLIYMTNFRHVTAKEPFEANIKNHQESSHGNLAVFDGNESIYYYSDHGDMPGIYKMNMNGTEMQFVVSCKDVKRMQIRNHNLYYLEYEMDLEDADISAKGYRLMKYDLAHKDSEQIVLYGREADIYGTWNFCVGNKGIVFTDLYFRANMRRLQERTAIKNWEGEYLGTVRKAGKRHVVTTTKGSFYLFDYGDLYCVSMEQDSGNGTYVDIWGQTGVYDKRQREPVIDGFSAPQIIGWNRELLFVYGNYLALYDDKRDEVLKEYVLENTSQQENLKMYGKQFVILGKTEDRNDQILSVDKENGIVHRLFEASEQEHVLYFDQESYILFNRGQITRCTYSGKEVWKVNLGKIRDTEGYRTDTSGDWLFVTHWNKRKKVRELDARIHMATGEVAED